MPLRALIFDVDGTLAETEEAHRAAFNQAFSDLGRDWHWTVDTYRALLDVTGGQQRIRQFLKTIDGTEKCGEIAAIHARKNALYAAMVAGGAVALRPGVARLIDEARAAGLRLAVATTTSRANFDQLLAHVLAPAAASFFDVVVAGEDVAVKKPHPEVYRRVLAALQLPAADCVAFEDSHNGLMAATACAIPTVVTPSFYTAHQDFPGAALVSADLDRPVAIDLAALNAVVPFRSPQGV